MIRSHPDPSSEPDFEQLRRTGWSLGTVVGRYCVVWREADEVVFHWSDGCWRQVDARPARRSSA